MTILPLSILEIKYIAHRLAQETMAWDEPIPSFSTRFPRILESCIAVPFQTYNKQPLYHGLSEKAAILFYLMVKNHPFTNGNKRIAITAMLVFLRKNGQWLQVDNSELYSFAKWVAESLPPFKTETVSAISKFIKANIVATP